MDFRGWIRTSLIEYPGKIASVVFTGGCNFRCPMCHNTQLVRQPDALPVISVDEVLRYLHRRAGLVTGLVVSGGEPTLHPDLQSFLLTVRQMGFATKLDTNGYRPDVLQTLLKADCLDYIAMDTKAYKAGYQTATGKHDLEFERIEASVRLICESGLEHEFRTTVVPQYLEDADIEGIAQWLASYGAAKAGSHYVLQQFRNSTTLDAAYSTVVPYPVEALSHMAELARRHIPATELRGI